VSIEGLDLGLELVGVLNLLSVQELDMLDVSLQDLDLLFSGLEGSSGLSVYSNHILPSEILLLVNFAKMDLLLLVLMIL
jgi:hypothetical protein